MWTRHQYAITSHINSRHALWQLSLIFTHAFFGCQVHSLSSPLETKQMTFCCTRLLLYAVVRLCNVSNCEISRLRALNATQKAKTTTNRSKQNTINTTKRSKKLHWRVNPSKLNNSHLTFTMMSATSNATVKEIMQHATRNALTHVLKQIQRWVCVSLCVSAKCLANEWMNSGICVSTHSFMQRHSYQCCSRRVKVANTAYEQHGICLACAVCRMRNA